MGKNRVSNSYEYQVKRHKAGVCTGFGMDYSSGLTGHEFASSGTYTRKLGETVCRQYVLFSRLEADVFCIYDHDPAVSDILDQYELPLLETLDISDRLSIKHPFQDRYYKPVTIDFLVCKTGTWVARSVKPSSELNRPRVIEKLRIEQEWCRLQGIEWKIVTENEINRDYVANLRWLYEDGAPLEELIPDVSVLPSIEKSFLGMYRSREMSLPDIIEVIEVAYSLVPGAGMAIFKHLIRIKEIELDMEKPRNMLHPWNPHKRQVMPYGRYGAHA